MAPSGKANPWEDDVGAKVVALLAAHPKADTFKAEGNKLYLATYNVRTDSTEFIEPRVEVPWLDDFVRPPYWRPLDRS